ncbi:MAG: hypothetical protein ABI559_08000 [Chloroflexota bacterium]
MATETKALENESLVLDLVQWIARESRPYAEVMEAWRTSCPRFPIWEDAVRMRFVVCTRERGSGESVCITPAGLEFLRSRGRVNQSRR